MSPIFLLGEAKGANEARVDRGFVGASGVELLRMLDEAKILELTAEDRSYISKYYNDGNPLHIDCVWNLHSSEVFRSNVFQIHPPGNKLEHFCGRKEDAIYGYPKLGSIGYVRQEFQPELDRLGNELLEHNPNLVLCLGNSALWALAGRTGVTKLRGTTCVSTHCVDGFKLLPTYHPAAILRQWDLRAVAVIDLMKAKREAEYPEIRRPHREIWIEPSLEDIERFINDHIQGCELLSVDIETSGNRVTCIGFAPSRGLALVIPFDDSRRKGRNYWPTQSDELACWELVKSILGNALIPKLMQNGLYDITFLWRAYGIKTLGAKEDTMLAHHALQPESLKGLGFLGSIYSDEAAWKTERKVATIKRDD